MFGRFPCGGFFLLAVMGASLADGQETRTKQGALTLADTRVELAGKWEGKLEYLDYQANEWFGIPVALECDAIKDRMTLVRKASFDDGSAGTVYITSVSMLSPDSTTEYVASFRADRPAEMSSLSIRLVEANAENPRDATHWTVIVESDSKDDNRPARIRETTTRNGDDLMSLKEVNFSDDGKDEWLQRNRTVLKKVRQ
jgi:hypothetical protein